MSFQTTTEKHKRGDVREDGMVFYGYRTSCKNGEWWMTPESYAIRNARAAELSAARLKRVMADPVLSTKRLAQKREHYHRPENKPAIRARQAEYNQRPEVKVAKAQRGAEYTRRPEVRENNNARMREYQRRRMVEDPIYALSRRARTRTHHALRNAGYNKTSKTAEMLGCSFEELHAHLESQFVDGMSWANMGGWHVDHIVPLASAKTEEELVALCHYTNLQPLWAFDNLSKGDKLPHKLT